MVLLPDNEPPFDDASLIEFVARRARQIKLANMYAYGALTVGLEGKELAEIGLMAEAGARRLHRRRPRRSAMPR